MYGETPISCLDPSGVIVPTGAGFVPPVSPGGWLLVVHVAVQPGVVGPLPMPSHAYLVLPGRIPGISILVSPWRSAAWTSQAPQVASERAPIPAVSIEASIEEEEGEKEDDNIRDNEGRRTCAIATGFPYL